MFDQKLMVLNRLLPTGWLRTPNLPEKKRPKECCTSPFLEGGGHE
jgi:hypothetical protein